MESPGEGSHSDQLSPASERVSSKKYSSGSQNSSQGSQRTPPQSLEAERSVLGAILVQNEAIDRVREIGLTGRDFYLDSHGKIFEAACALSDKREPVDLVTLTGLLRDRGWYDSIGGAQVLTSLFEDAFAVGNVGHYAKIVQEKAILRRMIETCSNIITDALDGVPDVQGFLDLAETQVFRVSDLHVKNAVTPLSQVLMGNIATIEELALRKEDVTGVATGFHEFDRLTTGLHPGQVLIVAARPGMGKTSWFLSALQNVAVKSKSVCALFSLEMSKEELGFRFLSGLSRIDARRLKTGKLIEHDWHRLADSADKLSKSKIFIDDSGTLTVLDIRARSRRLLSVEKRLDLIVIDYLQLMTGLRGGRGDQSREREISEISRGLKALSKELSVPIIVLSQLNRSVEARQDKRPTLADLRESGAIEQDADMVLFIHREEYYNRETENKGIAELILAKNRSGETGTVRVAWIGQYTLFANLAPHEAGMPVGQPRSDRGDIVL